MESTVTQVLCDYLPPPERFVITMYQNLTLVWKLGASEELCSGGMDAVQVRITAGVKLEVAGSCGCIEGNSPKWVSWGCSCGGGVQESKKDEDVEVCTVSLADTKLLKMLWLPTSWQKQFCIACLL